MFFAHWSNEKPHKLPRKPAAIGELSSMPISLGRLVAHIFTEEMYMFQDSCLHVCQHVLAYMANSMVDLYLHFTCIKWKFLAHTFLYVIFQLAMMIGTRSKQISLPWRCFIMTCCLEGQELQEPTPSCARKRTRPDTFHWMLVLQKGIIISWGLCNNPHINSVGLHPPLKKIP